LCELVELGFLGMRVLLTLYFEGKSVKRRNAKMEVSASAPVLPAQPRLDAGRPIMGSGPVEIVAV
jgi:hypothetical protein